ncbi:MAG: HEAT repeat domain-containing protein [Fibromonadales bacterium]|nr:HEAT repeat domain-containing protein [Fibromonadales bacterium]
MRRNILVFLICLFPHAIFALSDGSDFLIVPSAHVLGEKAFQVRGTLGYHHSSCTKNDESNMCDKYPFVSSLRFGLFNSLELGVQFGGTVSLDIKNQVSQAYSFAPAFSIGARAFVQSSEAYFYSVPKNERKEQTGEFYAVAQWGGDSWTILGGVSAFPVMDADAVAPFWGFEQNLGTPKLQAAYEGFFRYGFSHHNVGLSFKPMNTFQISAGATEFYRYFFSDKGDFKFRTKNPGAYTGYRSPGVYMSIAVNGGFTPSLQSRKAEVDSLKKQLSVHEKDLTFMRSRVDYLEMLYKDAEPNANSEYILDLQKNFQEIVDSYKADAFELDSLLAKEQVFIDRGMVAKRFIIREAKNKELAKENRITAIRVMSHFPDPIFFDHLAGIVADNSDEAVAREAALALGVINTPESRKALSAVANQTTGIVRETVIEIMGSL